VLARADSGRGTHEFLTWQTARSRRLDYSADTPVHRPRHAGPLRAGLSADGRSWPGAGAA